MVQYLPTRQSIIGCSPTPAVEGGVGWVQREEHVPENGDLLGCSTPREAKAGSFNLQTSTSHSVDMQVPAKHAHLRGAQ